jgi:hypothetical protein
VVVESHQDQSDNRQNALYDWLNKDSKQLFLLTPRKKLLFLAEAKPQLNQPHYGK